MRTSYIPIKKLLGKNDYIIRPVSGISMKPMLNQKTDTVKLIKPLNKIKTGDVVLYKIAHKKYALHRVCGENNKCFVIRGDNCVAFEYVPKRKIIAVMEGYYKCGEYIPADDPDYLRYINKILTEGKPLIPDEWRYLLKLYVCAVTGTKAPEPPSGVSWEDIYMICQRQKITSAVAMAISTLEEQPYGEICRKFIESEDMSVNRMLLYMSEREKIFSELDKHHIRYIPLKAIIIEKLYPKAGMREYADNDILYEKKHQADVLQIMTALGYNAVCLKGNHDIYYKQPVFNFELHRELFDQTSSYSKIFENIWDKAVPDSLHSSANHLTDEDFYLHFIVHFAKHYTDCGGGLRSLADLYLLKKQYATNKAFRTEYVCSELAKLGLVGFEMKMSSLTEKIFSDGEMDEYTLRSLMTWNVYGSFEKKLHNKIKTYGKLGFIIKRVFPDFSQMNNRFMFFGSNPFLYPVCWLWRIFSCVCADKKRKTMFKELKIIVCYKAKRHG